MKDIEVFIIEKPRKSKRPLNIVCNREQMRSPDHAQVEISNYGLDGQVSKISLDQLGGNVNSNLVVILDEDTYIPDDFINRAISFNNLFRDAGILCGPVYSTLESKFSKSYYNYNFNFGSSVVSDITNDISSYPSIIGCVISGEAYNRFLYKPTKSTRHISADNSFFLSSIAKQYRIYYSPQLLKSKYLDQSDLDINILSDYYYNLGYQDGLSISYKNTKEKHESLFDRFVNSPEMFDNTMPRWLFDSTPEQNGDYVELLVLAKCKYQIGFYEGMLGKEVI